MSLQAEDRDVHEQLERIVHEYRRLQVEHGRAARGSHTRRHLGARLQQLSARVERLLRGLDEQVAGRWRDCLRHGAPQPERPLAVARLVFRGRSATGSELRLLAREDGALGVLIDGALLGRLEPVRELAATGPGLTFRLEGTSFRETFVVSSTALAALRLMLEGGSPLSASAVGELLADGIIDHDRSVTARGRRALGLDASAARRAPRAARGVSVSIRGGLPGLVRGELERMLDRVADIAPSAPLRARASLVREENRSLERPVVGTAQLELPRRTVRAHAAAATAAEAVGQLEARLRRNLLDLRERAEARRRADSPPRCSTDSVAEPGATGSPPAPPVDDDSL
jgi:hypothetical protein